MSEEQKEKWYNSFTREQLIERCEYLQRSCERKENGIMELEMEIADLEKGYCELKEKCNKGECDCTNEEYDGMCEQNIKMYLEIERLNNIINEYDKWLESEIQRLEKIQSPKRGVKPYGQEYNNITLLIGAYDNALDKLQELKGDDKE